MSQNESLSLKRIPFYLFLILLGFLLFYIFDMLRGKNDQHIPPYVETKAGPIPKETAIAYINNYRAQQQADSNCRLVTPTDQILNGFWISKRTLHSMDSAIRKANPKAQVAGYSLYFGKPNATDPKRVYTLVLRGTILKEGGNIQNQQGMKMAGMAATLSYGLEEAGEYYDSVDPCPNRCPDNAE